MIIHLIVCSVRSGTYENNKFLDFYLESYYNRNYRRVTTTREVVNRW